MRTSSSALILYLLVTTAGICGIWYITSYNQSRGRMSLASVSEARGGSGATNASQVRLKNRGFNQIEDQLRRSLESLAPNQSIDSTLSTYRTPAPVGPPTRRERDALDRKKNWMFLTPEEMVPETSPQEFLRLKGLEGEETAGSSKGSAIMDRYYQRLEKKTASSLQPNPLSDEALLGTANSKKPAPLASARQDEPEEPAAVRRSENALRDLLTSSRDTSAASSIEPRLFGEAFNADQGKSFVDADAHRSYMKEYEGWLKNSLGASRPADALAGLPGPAQATSGGYRGSDLMGTGLRRTDLGSTAAAINPRLTPSPLPDPNASALNQWNTMYEPPKVTPPPAVAPTMPPTEAPRRKFF